MTITTYNELKIAIAEFLNRSDLDNIIPTFIALTEAQLNRDIRHWKMEVRSTGTQDAGDQYIQVPTDWLETIRLTHAANGRVLSLASRDDIARRRYSMDNAYGEPQLYCHMDGQIELYPTPSTAEAFELAYYAKITPLSDDDVNWVLLDHPDVYLYGALMHSAPYLAEDARAATWAQLYGSAVQNVNMNSDRARYSGSGLKLKNRGLR